MKLQEDKGGMGGFYGWRWGTIAFIAFNAGWAGVKMKKPSQHGHFWR
jgi:hypothetical protein